MTGKTFLVAGALLVAMPSGAFSATSPTSAVAPTAACSQLQGQFHSALDTHAQSDQRREARYLANEGRSWCETGYPTEGANDYRHALQILGVQPTA